MANTLAYYHTAIPKLIKGFIVQTLGQQSVGQHVSYFIVCQLKCQSTKWFFIKRCVTTLSAWGLLCSQLGACHQSGVSKIVHDQALLASVRLGWKWQRVTNTLAYNRRAKIASEFYCSTNPWSAVSRSTSLLFYCMSTKVSVDQVVFDQKMCNHTVGMGVAL